MRSCLKSIAPGDSSIVIIRRALGERQLFLSFAQFPWFREFTLRERRLHGDPAEVVQRLRTERDAGSRRTARVG